jgi:hypothetical protein
MYSFRKRLRLMPLCLLLSATSLFAQTRPDINRYTSGNLSLSRIDATGAQPNYCLQIDSGFNVVWAACASSGGGSGTVTSFGASGLSPLFTVSVANATTTPALSFTLSNAAAHTFFGNNTGSTAAPGFVSITAADLPGVFAQTVANASHKWLNSYDSSTGLFTQTQPDYSDLTGLPTLPANTTSTLHQFFTAYNSGTGAFTKAQPAYSDITGTPTLAATKTSIASNWLNSYDAATGLFTATRPAYTDLTGLPQLAITKAAVASNWIRSYDSTTGLFTASQPAYTDLTGTPTLPATLANAAHKWLNSYTSSTGLFTQTQPDYSDLTGAPTLPGNTTATAHQFFTAYNSATGAFTKAQPAYADLTGTPALPVTKTCTGTDKVSAYDSSTGLFTCTTDQTGAGGGGSGTVTDTLGALIAGQLVIGNGGDDIKVGDLSGDCTTSGSTATTCTKTNGAAFAASATTDATNAANIGSGTLDCARMPALTGDISTAAGSCTTNIGAGAVARADLAADAVGWQFSCTNTSTSSTITCTPGTVHLHYMVKLEIAGYSGTGVARLELGNASIVDTGSNYGFAGINLASGTSTVPTVSGIGSGSTAQEGCPVSGSTTTAGRYITLFISNPGARIKYFFLGDVGVGASAAVTPNLAVIGCTWSNTTNGIGVIQFKACTAINGSCSTVNFLTGTKVTAWGRDDN